MKTRVTSLLTFISVLGGFLVGPLLAAPTPSINSATSYHVQGVTRDGITIVKVGTTNSTVKYWLGRPDRMLSDDLWLYNRYVGSREEARDAGCDTLLLTLASGKVVDLKLVNQRARTIVVAKANSNPAKSQRLSPAE